MFYLGVTVRAPLDYRLLSTKTNAANEVCWATRFSGSQAQLLTVTATMLFIVGVVLEFQIVNNVSSSFRNPQHVTLQPKVNGTVSPGSIKRFTYCHCCSRRGTAINHNSKYRRNGH